MVDPWFGFFLAGILAAAVIFLIGARRERIPLGFALAVFVAMIVAGIYGAQLWSFIKGETLRIDWSLFWQFRGGHSWHGGFFAGIVVLGVASLIRSFSFYRLLDISAPAWTMGVGIGRIGCLLNGCCPGIPCDLPIFAHFGYRHPFPLYFSVAHLVVGLILLRMLIARRRFPPGTIFFSGLLVISGARILLEYTRISPRLVNGWTIAQVVSLILLLFSALHLVVLWISARKTKHRSIGYQKK